MIYYYYVPPNITSNTLSNTTSLTQNTDSPTATRAVVVIGSYEPTHTITPTDLLVRDLSRHKGIHETRRKKTWDGVFWAKASLETKPLLEEVPQQKPQRRTASKRRSAKAVRNWRRTWNR